MQLFLKFFLSALLLFALAGTMAAEAQTLVLLHADGTTTDVELLTQPKVTFKNDKVVITSTVLNMEYPQDDVLRFTFKDVPTSVASVGESVSYAQEGGRLVFGRLKPTDQVALYTAGGLALPVRLHRSGTAASISLSDIPSGTYILSINGRTSKFTKP